MDASEYSIVGAGIGITPNAELTAVANDQSER